MSVSSSIQAGIKSIQRGTISVTGASTTATITSVNTAKAQIRNLGQYGGRVGWGENPGRLGHVALTNATTVTATRENSDANLTIAYEVTEWY
jgi:hypothetical protein